MTDGIANLPKDEPVYAYEFEGTRHDAGTPLGWLKASISMALDREDLKEGLRPYLRDILNCTDA